MNVVVEAGLSELQSPLVLELAQQPYFSGGAAAGDYDDDGWVDLYITRQDLPDILYRNLGDGTFEDVTDTVFGANHLATIRTNGASWGDIDNDGDLDLYVTTFLHPQHLLYINDGQGGFKEEAVARGADVPDPNGHERWGFSSAFGDYDGDGYLDLHVTEWRAAIQSGGDQFARHNTRLLRNLGASAPGHFEDVTDAAGVATESIPSTGEELTNSEAFAPRFSDIDRDGHPDLLIASDHNTSRLYWNNGDGTFTDGTVAAGVGTDHNGMGSALGDYDNDGDMDWFVTSIFMEGGTVPSNPLLDRDGNRLYRYDGNRTFTDVTDAAGVRDGAWGWAAAFLDYDNDSDLDLAMTNGMNFPFGSFDDGFQDDQSVFWENDGSGVFTNVSDTVGVTDTRSGKGLLTFDYDKDGDVDIFLTNNLNSPILYRNEGGNDANWLRIDLVGTVSNRQAVGSFVTVIPDESQPNVRMLRELNTGNHYLGQSETTLHYGLGNATEVDEVEIVWPDGATTRHFDLAINSTHTFTQPTAPIITSRLEVEVSFGETFSYQISNSIEATSFEAENLPQGLAIDMSTGVISGDLDIPGVFQITIRANHSEGVSDAILVLVVKADYDEWAGIHFTEAGEDSPAIRGPDVDFDGDGRSNFEEYLDLTNPKLGDLGLGLSVSITQIGEDDFVDVTYPEIRHVEGGVATLEGTLDLLTWEASLAAGAELAQGATDSGLSTKTIRQANSIEGGDREHYRVKRTTP